MRLLGLFLVGIIAGLGGFSSQARSEPVPITVGVSHEAETHGAKRRINVLLPLDYEESDRTYPLIVLLDGGTQQDLFLQFGIYRWNQLWGRSREAIIVGIETVDRQRELLPATRNPEEKERYPNAGEADAFREWLAQEVLPMLRSFYRDNGEAMLIGESAAGHFVAETWVKTPQMFDGYAAFSPSLQWDEQSLSRSSVLAQSADRPPFYLSLADEGGATEEGALRFVAAAQDSVCFADQRESHVRHANALHQTLPGAMQFLLPTPADWLEEYGLVVNCRTGQE